MTRELTVSLAEREVGALSEDAAGRFTFAYAPAWLDDPGSFAISLSLPLREQPHESAAAHAFFANLLPEGRVRTMVARRLGLSEDNDFALLAALGGDCAGALAISESPPLLPEQRYRPLAPEELERLVRTGNVLSQLSGQDGIRLSLAGAQDKLPVHVGAGGELSLPLGSSPSTHLLKFASRDFKHLPANEAFVGALARDLGLPAVQAELRTIGRGQHLLVERYDRTRDDAGVVSRLHQEDLCQALGLRPTQKYEEEGGPNFAQCYEEVADHSAEPALDTASLLRWLAFNVVVGNADGHAKNLSLLRGIDGRLRLAPSYDLVCTAAYPTLSRNLAMSIGRTADPGEIRGSDWRELAARIGVRSGYLVDLVRHIAESAPGRAAVVADEFRDHYGASPVLQMILTLLRKRARRTLHLLGV